MSADHWLGLEKMYLLTKQVRFESISNFEHVAYERFTFGILFMDEFNITIEDCKQRSHEVSNISAFCTLKRGDILTLTCGTLGTL